MKKMFMLIMLLVIMLVPFVSSAENTGGADYDYDTGWLGDFLGHGHGYTDANTQRARRWQVGAGLDLILLERSAKQNNLTPLVFTSETRIDVNNKFNGTQYFVVTYRLSEVWKGIVDLVGLGE